MNILLINGHEYWETSPGRLNNSLVEFASLFFNNTGSVVETTVVEHDYDLEKEVQKILWADIILIFSPVYWMGITAKLKSYFDHVYAHSQGRFYNGDGRKQGGQYGSGGLLVDTKYMLITTWNAPSEAFGDDKQFLFEGKTVDDVFLNFHAMQKFTGMKKMTSFSLHDVKQKPNIDHFIESFENHLNISF
ncbi:MAG: NAD(P)H-dependent oxidoreductase [Bacteroidales bacterium]|nr:NAD(P)H-dependent oxidoreductase [Bacteroidales bacterium]